MIRLLIGVVIIGSATVLSAQTPARYDRAAETTVSGTIKAVVAFPAEDGSVGVHVDLPQGEAEAVLCLQEHLPGVLAQVTALAGVHHHVAPRRRAAPE